MATTFCVSGAVLNKAGGHVSGAVHTTLTEFINQAESVICADARYDFVDDYSSMVSQAKLILEDTCSNLAAINAIIWDMNSYPSRVMAEDSVNILRDAAMRNMSIIRDKKTQTWMKGET